MAFAMALPMSFVMTAVNDGFSAAFLGRWMRSAVTGLAIAIPASLIVAPLIHRIVNRLTKS